MRVFATVMFLLLVIWASWALALDDNEEAAPNLPPSKFLVYSVTWQPTFCVMRPETPGCDFPPQRFLTHGIWPYSESIGSHTNRHPQFCTSSPACNAEEACPMGADQLREVLANNRLRALVTREPGGMFAHEWKKHGTCSGSSMRDYFEDFVRLRKAVVYDQTAFARMIGNATEFSEVRKVFPANTAFRCYRNSDGEQYLHEVFFLIDREGRPYLQEKDLQIGVQCLEQKTLVPGGV